MGRLIYAYFYQSCCLNPRRIDDCILHGYRTDCLFDRKPISAEHVLKQAAVDAQYTV